MSEKVLSTKTFEDHVTQKVWRECPYCEGSGGPDRCGCEVCCICKGAKGHTYTQKAGRYLCIDGPFEGQKKTQLEAREYVLFNRSSYYSEWNPPKCVLVHKSAFTEIK